MNVALSVNQVLAQRFPWCAGCPSDESGEHSQAINNFHSDLSQYIGNCSLELPNNATTGI